MPQTPSSTPFDVYRIFEIDPFTGNRTSFDASFFELDVPDNTVASGYLSRKVSGLELRQLLAAGNNERLDLVKRSRTDNAQHPFYQAGDETTAGLLTRPLELALGTRIRQEFPAAEYEVVFDGAPTPQLQVKSQPRVGAVLAPAKLALLRSPEQTVLAYEQYPPGYLFTANSSVVRSYAGGSDELFFKAKVSGPLPAPSDPDGDANWELIGREEVPVPPPADIPGTNGLRGTPKLCLFETEAQRLADPGQRGEVAELINPELLCLDTPFTIQFPLIYGQNQQVVAFDNSATPQFTCYLDGKFDDNELVPAKRVWVGDADAVAREYSTFPAGFDFKAGQFVRTRFTGDTFDSYFTRTVDGPAARPVAGGDADWQVVAKENVPIPAYALTQQQVMQLQALASQFYSPDQSGNGRFKGFNTIDDALDYVLGANIYLQFQSAKIVAPVRDCSIDSTTLYGKGHLIVVGAGITLDGFAYSLDNISIQVQPGGAVNGLPISARNGQLQGSFPAVSRSDFYDYDLASADITGTGTMYLYGSSTYPNSVAAGVTVIDLRPVDYDTPSGIVTAVKAGAFTNGELQGTQPAGSTRQMEFSTNTYWYKFMRGNAGTLVWCRLSKG